MAQRSLAVLFALTLTPLTPVAVAAALVGPFEHVDVVRLVLNTPGVARDASQSSSGHIYVNVEGMKFGGFIRPEEATSGQTIEGDWLLAVPLDTGKPVGAYTALVYRSTGAAPDYIAAVDSKRGMLAVSVHDGHLFITAPLFGKHDLPCCPSAKVVQRMLYSKGIDGLIVVTTEKIDLSKRRQPSPKPSP